MFAISIEQAAIELKITHRHCLRLIRDRKIRCTKRDKGLVLWSSVFEYRQKLIRAGRGKRFLITPDQIKARADADRAELLRLAARASGGFVCDDGTPVFEP